MRVRLHSPFFQKRHSEQNVLSRPHRSVVFITLLLSSTVLGGTGAWPQSVAPSQDGGVTMLDPIVITARRHREDAQTVPISTTIIEGRELEEISPVTSNADIARSTPNFVLNEGGGPYTNVGHIRGVGSLFTLSPDDTSVTFNVDEVPMSAFGIPPSTLDLSRVEVLRGPQGTLYGRNSQAGAVNFISNRPEFLRELRLRGEIGTNGWHLGEIIANAPLVDDVLAGRLALQYSRRSGDIRNVVQGGEDGSVTIGAARGSLLWTPTDATSVLLSLNYNRNDDTSPLWVLRDANCYPCSGLDPRNDFTRQMYGSNLRIEHDFDAFRFTSLSSFQTTDTGQRMDLADGLIFGALGIPPCLLNVPGENLSLSELRERNLFQEFRLSSLEGAAVQWTAGVNYFRSDFDMRRWAENITIPSFATYSGRLNTDLTTNSYAAFGEASIPLTDRLTGIVGARVTHEEKRVGYAFQGDGLPGTADYFTQDGAFSDTFFTGRVGLSYRWTDGLMTYATVGRGAVAGGFPWNPYNVPTGVNEPSFPTSLSWTYETGFKATLWDGRAMINGALFYNDVRDGHLLSFNPDVFAYTITTLDYETYGGELEARVRVTPDLTLFGGIGYTHAAFGNVPEPNLTGARSGGRVPGIPQFTGHIGAEYRIDAERVGLSHGQFYANATYQYVGSRGVDVQRTFDLDAYGVVNGRLGWQGDKAEFYVFANNLFDERYEVVGGSYGAGAEIVRAGVGRTVGLGASFRF